MLKKSICKKLEIQIYFVLKPNALIQVKSSRYCLFPFYLKMAEIEHFEILEWLPFLNTTHIKNTRFFHKQV